MVFYLWISFTQLILTSQSVLHFAAAVVYVPLLKFVPTTIECPTELDCRYEETVFLLPLVPKRTTCRGTVVGLNDIDDVPIATGEPALPSPLPPPILERFPVIVDAVVNVCCGYCSNTCLLHKTILPKPSVIMCLRTISMAEWLFLEKYSLLLVNEQIIDLNMQRTNSLS